MTAPDLTQKVLGYREFFVASEDDDRLSSLTTDYTWQPGPNHASCRYIPGISTGWPHSAPQALCGCGLYGWHNCPPFGEVAAWAAWWRGAPTGAIAAAVLAWGRMQVHRDGFRAEHAEIVLLGYRPDEKDRVERCAAYYGVRAVPIDTLGEEARLLGAPAPESLRPPSDHARQADARVALQRAQRERARALRFTAALWLGAGLASLIMFLLSISSSAITLGFGIAELAIGLGVASEAHRASREADR